ALWHLPRASKRLAPALQRPWLIYHSKRDFGRASSCISRPMACCGSSVVEHSLGKGEVESSILSHSTSFSQNKIKQLARLSLSGASASEQCGKFCVLLTN